MLSTFKKALYCFSISFFSFVFIISAQSVFASSESECFYQFESCYSGVQNESLNSCSSKILDDDYAKCVHAFYPDKVACEDEYTNCMAGFCADERYACDGASSSKQTECINAEVKCKNKKSGVIADMKVADPKYCIDYKMCVTSVRQDYNKC